MSPAEREMVAKMSLMPTSVNAESRRSSDESTDDGRAAREVRNKYLKRIGVGGDGGNASDNEPLLQ
jgi:hypothetical protein